MSSPVADKLALYTDRFRARTDMYALRWDNARTGVSGWMPAVAGGWRKGMDRKGATYLPLTAKVVSAHLVGDVFIGLYPLLAAPALDTLFLAAPVSFDGLLVQCAGRIIRAAPGKEVAEVHDYHDRATPILAASLPRRMPGYRTLGFTKA